MAISPDSHWLLTGSSDNTACLWELKSGQAEPPRKVLVIKHQEEVTAVAFSPNGRRLITASEDKTVQLWSLPATAAPAFSGCRRACGPDSGAQGRHQRAMGATGVLYPAQLGPNAAKIYQVNINPDLGPPAATA